MKLDISKSGVVLSEAIKAKAEAANELLYSGKGKGNDFLGWVKLPSSCLLYTSDAADDR